VPIEAQIMRGKYGYPPQTRVDALSAAANRWLTRRSPWHVTHVLDPFAVRALEPLPHDRAIRLIPEPVEPLPALGQREARTALQLPDNGRYLAFVGGAEARKGIEFLVTAFARAKLAHDDRLLFVGRVAKSIREWLHDEHSTLLRQDRIMMVDRYVSDFELDCGFLAGDVVAVTHPRQIGSSGTLVRAAAAKRPVLASDFGWVAWVTVAFHLGAVVNVLEIDRYSAAIETALESASRHRVCEAAERFCQYHSVANQKRHWVAEIGAKRGLPIGILGDRIDWQWVLDAISAKEAA
jgi:glycosyltransferase involved in cell wall biosynthesis